MRYRLLLCVTLCISIRLFAQQDPTPIHSLSQQFRQPHALKLFSQR